MDLPVTIVGVGSGLSYDTAGLTHHGTEDLSTMRTIPNMNIVNISTIEMAKWYAKFSMEYKHPLYVRLDKKAYNQTFIPLYGWFTHNYGVVNRVNKNVAIITTGVFTQYLLEQKSVLPKNSFILEVYRFPCEQKKLSTFLESCAKIITVEEGYTTGGLGDYIASLGFKVTKIGLSTFCETQLRQHYWDKLLTEIKNELQGEKREGR
jgi:transketolase